MEQEPIRNLKRYLEVEGLLNRFFQAFNFCLPHCIRVLMSTNDQRPVAACCQKPYHTICDLEHPAYRALQQAREAHYGKPEDYHWTSPVSPCPYHNPSGGCVLPTHKSPICIAFLCRKGIDRLRSHYAIFTYDYLGVYYALEWILTGDLKGKQYVEFRDSIANMTCIIEKVNSSLDQTGSLNSVQLG